MADRLASHSTALESPSPDDIPSITANNPPPAGANSACPDAAGIATTISEDTMKPGRPKTQLQLINEDQEFSQDFAQYLSDVWKLEDNGFDYNIVAVFGSQSSGKSTLLNRLFGTEFEVMSTERRRQTTKGIWADKSTYKSNIIVLDVEGTDGSERGEDQEFERKSALFSLAISEVLVVNIWENTVGLYNSANMGLLKTVFEVNLELFGKEKDVKTLLFFSIRDHTSEVTLDALSDTLMHDLESVWERISKPESLKDAKITDYFDFAFSSLPNKPLQPQEFEDRAAKLRGRFIDPKHDNYVFNSKYKRRIPVDGIPHYAASIWEKIVTNKDLDLPTQQELLAQYRCDEISRQVVERFHQEIQPIREAIDSGKPSATENIGGTMAKVRGSAISEFESHASRYQRSVYEKSRQQLLGLLNSDLCILYVRLIKQASNAAVREFSNRVKKRLGSAARSNEEYEFMDIVRKTQDEVRGDFRRLAEETRLPDTDWSYDDEAAHLDQMMDNIIDELRKGEISRIMDRTRNVLKREISDVLAAELNEPTDKMWGTVLGSFAEINAKVERTFSQRIQPIVSEEPARRAMIKQMRELAWGDLVAKAREEVSDQMVLLKLRNYLEERFRYDSQGLPRVWMPSDDIDGQFDRARTETLKLIPGYCKIDVGAWDESKYGPLSDYFTTEIDVEGTQQLISAAKAREVQRRFQREADALYLEAKRSTVSTQSRIPYWMFLLTVILGWNEAMTIIFNPIYLVFFVFVLSASFIVHQLGLWGPVYRLSGTFGNMVAEKAHVLLLEAVNKTEPMAINARRDAAPLESLRSSDASQGTPARQFGRKRHGLTRHGSAQKTSAHPFSSSQNGEDNEMIPLDDLSHRRGHLSDE